jgi:hypothetical protein
MRRRCVNLDRRIQVAIGLLREALNVLSEGRPEEYPYLFVFPKEELAVLREIRNTTSETFALLRQTSTYAQKTLKSSCPGCDRDLMLRVDGNNLILECYNPDRKEHQARGVAATRWKLTPTQVK